MHDPMTVAFTIRYPWRAYAKDKVRNEFERTYRHPFITIWHVDPENGPGGDDSCGWFMRSHHGDQIILDRIKKRYAEDWDRVFISDESGKMYPVGYLFPNGEPRFSISGIVINLFFLAALEHFGGRDKAAKWMRRNLFEILWFAENPVDSLYDGLTNTFGVDSHERREDRIARYASTVYGWILRESRPWYRHPRWHVWHWKLQVHPWQAMRRFLLSRCSKCGGRFTYGYAPVSDSWDRPKAGFLRGEVGLRHSNCAEDRP